MRKWYLIFWCMRHAINEIGTRYTHSHAVRLQFDSILMRTCMANGNRSAGHTLVWVKDMSTLINFLQILLDWKWVFTSFSRRRRNFSVILMMLAMDDRWERLCFQAACCSRRRQCMCSFVKSMRTDAMCTHCTRTHSISFIKHFTINKP